MNQRVAGVQNMPSNNNQKGPSAAARLAKLPVVHSACSKLLVLYADTTCSHPNLKSVCEVLENKVTALGSAACDRVSPVMAKLQPQISIANDVACKGLDWLETRFPVLHSPIEEVTLTFSVFKILTAFQIAKFLPNSEIKELYALVLCVLTQVVATAKTKMHGIQDAVSIAAIGTMGVVQHTVTLLMERTQQADDGTNQSLVKRAIDVAIVGMDSALNMSEALVDHMLPPTEEDKAEEATHIVVFEATTLRSYPVRLVSLAAKLCRRSCHVVWAKIHSVEVTAIVLRSSSLVPDLQTTCLTLAWSIQRLPQYLQHQVVSVFFFISQMYNLHYPPSEQNQSRQVRSHLNTADSSSPKDVVEAHPQGISVCRLRPTKMSAFENGCTVKGYMRR
ncbi:Perilipin-2 Adipophilin Adipose differentiation-related protein [Channa argus]|uniref:Perilipin-2 Adipophilin Adipose differentiation-related protein n=1 Tax=Channa argus TaxID=215402 RepID=A0A6G1PBT7_CHAAH|nr:Perilipin-2 Adipophilin Adipose differentiation-related protein [Channa argus]